MKKYFLFILIMSFMITQTLAESITITSPTSNQTIYIPSGQSTRDIQVC